MYGFINVPEHRSHSRLCSNLAIWPMLYIAAAPYSGGKTDELFDRVSRQIYLEKVLNRWANSG